MVKCNLLKFSFVKQTNKKEKRNKRRSKHNKKLKTNTIK